MIRYGYVRVKTDHDEVSVWGCCVSPSHYSLVQAHGNVYPFVFDDANPEVDFKVIVINRLNQPESEIEIETRWWTNEATEPIIHMFDCYYTETKVISARECVLGLVPEEGEDG
jgi:hypothetical protein